MTQSRSNIKKLPAKEKHEVIDVSMKHVIFGFSILFAGVFITGTSVISIRDYSRYRRQKALLDTTMQLVNILKGKDENGKT